MCLCAMNVHHETFSSLLLCIPSLSATNGIKNVKGNSEVFLCTIQYNKSDINKHSMCSNLEGFDIVLGHWQIIDFSWMTHLGETNNPISKCEQIEKCFSTQWNKSFGFHIWPNVLTNDLKILDSLLILPFVLLQC